MTTAKRSPLLSWTVIAPILGIAVLAATWGRESSSLMVIIAAIALGATVLAAVHHAEVVAHRVGEPYGSLVLAVAVTVIEVALIVTVMASGGHDASTLARDTVFAAVMITTNGIVGIALLVGALKYGTTLFNPEGSGAALATVATLATLGLVLPTFTTSESGPEYSTSQLMFAALASLVLYGLFVFTQTRRHRDFFLPVTPTGVVTEEEHADPPSGKTALLSLVMLMVALVGVVGLAKVESPAIKAGVDAAGFPPSAVGVAIALLVLLPESIAAVRAASRERIQTSINLGYGSAMASIGLTIPVIAVASFWMEGPLMLGLSSTEIVLLGLTMVVSVLTIVPGRATRLQGGVHLVLLAAFLFLAINP
ncbi:calcium:proton antiporter [Glycomyces paridis]|uniref:Ionic transporter y4hA n=1 Tax=Glycomyces paridis TaxID=2126555 RepID=A0A4S8PC29_9ACTN|nr:ionic transporter y4hA [Glycomyces paridis]THV27898.1 ionic transporter y4hA [Glycomyces paridis]